ncbi:MAG TPA: hypothetical protein VJP06_00145 [Thermoplasmata archaeon]|nr:hypothetical protein [Thermoplasmata archaeon]
MICAIAIAVAFVSAIVRIILYALLVVFCIAPGILDRTVFGRRRPRV